MCVQNSVISTRKTSLYVSKPSSVVFKWKTATFGPELQVSTGTRPHLSFCACKTAQLAPELLVSMCPRPHLWFWAHITACLALWLRACNTATLGPELHVSVGPWSHLWFFHVIQPLFPRISSLYGSQVWPVVLCIHNNVISTWISSLYGFQPFRMRLISLYGSQTSPVVLCMQTRVLQPELLVSMSPSPHL